MVRTNIFDLTVNAFGDLVTEVFTGTDENQKAKLRRVLEHFTKISNGAIKRKSISENRNIQPKKMRPLVIHDILPPEMLEKIFKFLNFKEICQAQLICRKWKGIIENGNLMKKAADKVSCILIAGGSIAFGVRSKFNEILTGDLKIKQLPNLQQSYSTSIVSHNGTLLMCGGYKENENKCFQLDNGLWKEHSVLNESRTYHSTVTTKTATFLFGGYGNCCTTYEYLLKDSTTWLTGKTKIPMGFINGTAIAVKSGQEIWLIGGKKTDKRILAFDVSNHTFQELPSRLNVMRLGHRCAFIPNTDKVMITGGMLPREKWQNSTEILDTNDGSVYMASSMNCKRVEHGMGTMTINGEDRLVVFGGTGGNKQRITSVEIYNNQTKKWETSKIKLKEPRANFSSLNVKLSELIPNSKYLQGSHDIFEQTFL